MGSDNEWNINNIPMNDRIVYRVNDFILLNKTVVQGTIVK